MSGGSRGPQSQEDLAAAVREEARALGVGEASNTVQALRAQLVRALRHLTIVPTSGGAGLGHAALFFPLVGLGLGSLLVCVDTLVPAANLPRSVLVVAVLVAVTAARHLSAVGRAIPGPAIAGPLAIVAVLAIKIRSLELLTGGARMTGLFIAPMLGRWALVAFAFGSRPARGAVDKPEILKTLSFREFAIASVFAIGVTLAYAEASGLITIFVLASLLIIVRLVVHQRHGGVTPAMLEAVPEVAEALVLAIFALTAVGGSS